MKQLIIYMKLAFLLGILIFMYSCDKDTEGKLFKVYDEKMIDELMEEDPNMSMFLEIVDRAELRGTIHAYGTYTLFAPDNEGVKKYLESKGKSNVSDLTEDEAAKLVTYHLINDTIPTADFVDGKMAAPNFQKRYLVTKTIVDDGNVVIQIDRQSNVLKKDLSAANGYLHIINNVLQSPSESVADRINNLTDNEFSFMKDLVRRSGITQELDNEASGKWFTFFIQDNQSFKNAGINSYNDLIAKLRLNTPDITDENVLLYNYVAYHCIPELRYVSDLLNISSQETLMPLQVITFKRDYDKLLLNEFEQNGVLEEGVLLDRNSEYSDLSCSNGVIQKLSGNIEFIKRKAYAVYWDIAEQPEIMALKNFRKKGAVATFSAGDLSEITWGGGTHGTFTYQCLNYSETSLDEKSQYVYGDYLRLTLSTAVNQWVEMKMPLLVEGTYKVWICYRREMQINLRAIFKQDGLEDQTLPLVLDMSPYMPNPNAAGSSHEQIEIDGWKQYNAKKYNSVMCSRLLGTIVVEKTGRHTLRFEALSNNRFRNGSWDMIHFIPVDEDQIWPKFDLKGKKAYSDTPNCQIFPYSVCE